VGNMRDGWWVARGAVGGGIGLILGAMGGDMGIVAMGGIIGVALGLGFPDRNQRVIRQHTSRPPDSEAPPPDPEVWPPPPRKAGGR
jgi:hypothetical protein